MRIAAAAALLMALCGAVAARAQVVTQTAPPPFNGYASLSVTTASAALSGATVGPNSPAFPASSLPSRFMAIRNAAGSAGILYVCPLGGTCSSSVGIGLAVGETLTVYLVSQAGSLVSPTVIAASTATAVAIW